MTRIMTGRGIMALAAGALLLGACAKTTDRVVFTALTGEAPGTRPAYINMLGEHPIGRPPPQLGGAVYRPPEVPEFEAGETPAGARAEEVKADYARLRLLLSDRDDALQFRRRSLSLALGHYMAAVNELRLQHGDPLPLYNDALKTRIEDAKRALSEARAELLQLSNLYQATEADLVRIDRVREQAVAARETAPAESAAGKLAGALVDTLDDAGKAMRGLRSAAEKDMASTVEYLEGQRQSLEDFEAQVRAAADAPADEGPQRPDILKRRSIFDR